MEPAWSLDSTQASTPREMELLKRESQEHGGEVVARFPNGENVYADTFRALFQLLDERGLSLDHVRFEDIPEYDVIEILRIG
jgi:hypothetical protein